MIATMKQQINATVGPNFIAIKTTRLVRYGPRSYFISTANLPNNKLIGLDKLDKLLHTAD